MRSLRTTWLLFLLAPLAADDEPIGTLWWDPPQVQIDAGESRPLAIRTASGIDMVLLPAGPFLLGSPDGERGRRDNEGALHLVTISRPFYVNAAEVTQSQWFEVMGRNPSNLQEAGDNAPVESISWYDAVLFCNQLSVLEGLDPAYRIENMEVMCHSCQSLIDAASKTCRRCGCILRTSRRPIYSTILAARVTFLGFDRSGYRLPTEAEWEYACRAGSITPYHTGSDIAIEQANFRGSLQNPEDPTGDWGSTVSVGSYPPNAWGLYDMHGNVSEWCWDRFGAYPEVRKRSDPTGPERGDERVRRGGTWGNRREHCRSARRDHAPPSFATPTVGLRPVRTAVDP